MAERPAFFPKFDEIGVETRTFDFEWHPGFAPSQKKKNVAGLHGAIAAWRPGCKALEISRRSELDAGVALSAFNLKLPVDGTPCTVEAVFQAGKVFEDGVGPFPELRTHGSKEVRDIVRARSAGHLLVAFEADGVRWPLLPRTAFYDWLYLKALVANPDLAAAVEGFDCFTDIEFNPEKSLNCQAAAAALYRSLRHAGRLEEALSSQEAFLRVHPA
jgi:hypothetical protein